MKKIKKLAITMIIFLMLPLLYVNVEAEEQIDFFTTLSSQAVKPGETVTATVLLKNYTGENTLIRGVQIDVTEIDRSKLEVVECKSLIEDTSGISNEVTYSMENRRVRLLYVQTEKTLPTTNYQLLQMTFRVDSELKDSGTIILPIEMKMQTTTGPVTLTGECRIPYSATGEPVTSVDITWGAMDYEYESGQWNTKEHRYDGQGWQDKGSGYVTVKNNGAVPMQAELFYETKRSEITGKFVGEHEEELNRIRLDSGQQQKIKLLLSGILAESLQQESIGTVTIKIGGDE